MMREGGILLASAEAYTIGLNDDPGCRMACRARLNFEWVKSRPPISARTPPVKGSMAMNMPWT